MDLKASDSNAPVVVEKIRVIPGSILTLVGTLAINLKTKRRYTPAGGNPEIDLVIDEENTGFYLLYSVTKEEKKIEVLFNDDYLTCVRCNTIYPQGKRGNHGDCRWHSKGAYMIAKEIHPDLSNFNQSMNVWIDQLRYLVRDGTPVDFGGTKVASAIVMLRRVEEEISRSLVDTDKHVSALVKENRDLDLIINEGSDRSKDVYLPAKEIHPLLYNYNQSMKIWLSQLKYLIKNGSQNDFGGVRASSAVVLLERVEKELSRSKFNTSKLVSVLINENHILDLIINKGSDGTANPLNPAVFEHDQWSDCGQSSIRDLGCWIGIHSCMNPLPDLEDSSRGIRGSEHISHTIKSRKLHAEIEGFKGDIPKRLAYEAEFNSFVGAKLLTVDVKTALGKEKTIPVKWVVDFRFTHKKWDTSNLKALSDINDPSDHEAVQKFELEYSYYESSYETVFHPYPDMPSLEMKRKNKAKDVMKRNNEIIDDITKRADKLGKNVMLDDENALEVMFREKWDLYSRFVKMSRADSEDYLQKVLFLRRTIEVFPYYIKGTRNAFLIYLDTMKNILSNPVKKYEPEPVPTTYPSLIDLYLLKDVSKDMKNFVCDLNAILPFTKESRSLFAFICASDSFHRTTYFWNNMNRIREIVVAYLKSKNQDEAATMYTLISNHMHAIALTRFDKFSEALGLMLSIVKNGKTDVGFSRKESNVRWANAHKIFERFRRGSMLQYLSSLDENEIPLGKTYVPVMMAAALDTFPSRSLRMELQKTELETIEVDNLIENENSIEQLFKTTELSFLYEILRSFRNAVRRLDVFQAKDIRVAFFDPKVARIINERKYDETTSRTFQSVLGALQGNDGSLVFAFSAVSSMARMICRFIGYKEEGILIDSLSRMNIFFGAIEEAKRSDKLEDFRKDPTEAKFYVQFYYGHQGFVNIVDLVTTMKKRITDSLIFSSNSTGKQVSDYLNQESTLVKLSSLQLGAIPDEITLPVAYAIASYIEAVRDMLKEVLEEFGYGTVGEEERAFVNFINLEWCSVDPILYESIIAEFLKPVETKSLVAIKDLIKSLKTKIGMTEAKYIKEIENISVETSQLPWWVISTVKRYISTPIVARQMLAYATGNESSELAEKKRITRLELDAMFPMGDLVQLSINRIASEAGYVLRNGFYYYRGPLKENIERFYFLANLFGKRLDKVFEEVQTIQEDRNTIHGTFHSFDSKLDSWNGYDINLYKKIEEDDQMRLLVLFTMNEGHQEVAAFCVYKTKNADFIEREIFLIKGNELGIVCMLRRLIAPKRGRTANLVWHPPVRYEKKTRYSGATSCMKKHEDVAFVRSIDEYEIMNFMIKVHGGERMNYGVNVRRVDLEGFCASEYEVASYHHTELEFNVGCEGVTDDLESWETDISNSQITIQKSKLARYLRDAQGADFCYIYIKNERIAESFKKMAMEKEVKKRSWLYPFWIK
jgi:hypothetical protein